MKLVSADENILKMITPFGTWLHVAATKGKLDIVKLLLSLGIDINRRGGTFDGSAINEAAGEGHYDVVEFLLSCGAELDTTEPERKSHYFLRYTVVTKTLCNYCLTMALMRQ